jgi:hypothetical protein
MASLIGSVTWTPQQPAAGQSVRIDVCDPASNPYCCCTKSGSALGKISLSRAIQT